MLKPDPALAYTIFL